MPPATAASKSRSTPAASATANSSVPKLASSSLLPVITGFPLRSAVVISSRAGSIPPISSTTRSIVGSLTIAMASPVSSPAASCTARCFFGSLTATDTTSSRTLARASIAACCALTSATSWAPTLPHPRTPILITFTVRRLRVARPRNATHLGSATESSVSCLCTGMKHSASPAAARNTRLRDCGLSG